VIVQQPQTAHFTISYDDTITANANHPSGATLAQSVLDYCEYDYARLSSLFGTTLQPQNLPISVMILPGNGTASNDGLATITCTVGALDEFPEPGVIEPKVIPELAEIFMAA